MIESRIALLNLISFLLQYPDEEMLGRLDELAAIADGVYPGETRSVIQEFLKGLGRMTPIQAQERYTAVFDMNPSTTLSVTYHAYGDNEKRAAALARLQHHYELAGWERITGELPDYLPLMLEFLSICTSPEHTAPVWQCLKKMQPLIDGLKERAPGYADLLQTVCRMAVDGCATVGRDEMRNEAMA
ncbi:MAG TPA: nitrate reductase molybdenum cofactor assembly chaperone [Desulfosarcina sp.]|nr:nitrate reductase molybdenum cofactor assembly chaperone [Desulfosarcina sp.]